MNTKTISSTQAQNNFGRILDDITQNNTRYVVKRRDAPQVILLSVSDFQALLSNQSEQDKLGKIIRELRPEYHLGETVDQDSIR
ncbi:MAG: type II toxin-antitoxin system Phd/YefM family antitoxin [Caldilinea sp. CFX5]|nr:type II toxin-antitoxin system Phd/YefM family antitoxin [Caldilinea sp. CFX5]